jgi:hypothetical protein
LFDLKFDPKPDRGVDQKLDRQNLDRQQLAALGDVRTPGISDLFVAMLGDKPGNHAVAAQGVAQ